MIWLFTIYLMVCWKIQIQIYFTLNLQWIFLCVCIKSGMCIDLSDF